ncbi:MAG: hypothetical protein ACRDJK_05155, partial [Actinomycetota bacterium]
MSDVERRASIVGLALLLALLAGAFIVVLVSERRPAGSVPGEASIISMAAIAEGLLVGSERGVATTADAARWTLAPLPGALRARRALVASSEQAAFVLVGEVLFLSEDLRTYQRLSDRRFAGTALTATPQGSVFIAGGGHLWRVDPGGAVEMLELGPSAPREILSLGAAPGRVFYAGGLLSGLWRSEDGGASWRRLLGTPNRTVLIDRRDARRILLGTPGGILISKDGGLSWRFTGMRHSVSGLAEREGEIFAVTADRLLYH